MVSLENAFIAGLMLIALIILIWLALSQVVRRWKSQFVQRATRLQIDLADVEQTFSRIEQEAQQYAPNDPEPYGPLARDLHHTLAQVQNAHSNHAQQRSQLLRQVPMPRGSRFSRFWFNLGAEFYRWWQLRREAESLWESTQTLQAQVTHAGQLLQDLRRVPLTVSRRCNDLRQVSYEISQITPTLYDAGLHGDTIDSAAADAKRLSARLMDLPACFFQSAERLVIKEATRQSTILAWQTLGEIEEPIWDHRDKLQQWQFQHRQAGQMLQTMQIEIDAVQQHLAQVSHSVDVSALVAKLEQSSIEAQELEEQYLAPTIKVLDILHDRARQITETAKDLTKLSDSLRQQLDSLRESIRRYAGLLDRVQAKMTEVARVQSHPIDWEHHRAKLAHLRRMEAKIGPITAQRTPDRLFEHVTMALQLAQEGHRLNSNVTETRTHRDELIALLRRPPLATRPTWIMQAEDLHNQASKYAPANWPREWAVSEILKDAKELARRYQHWVPAHASQPLPATKLGYRVEGLKKLAADLEVFRNRLQQVADTLGSVQTIEQTACQELGIACQAAERLTTCMRRAKPSFATSIVIHQRKLEKLQDESHRLTSELERRHAGLVKDKARNVDDWTESCHKALQAVLKALQAESRKVEAELRDEAEELQEVAPFDRERAMQEAKRLLDLERPPDLPPLGKADDTMAAQISLLVNQLDEMLQDRQSLHVALENIRFQIRDRIHDLFETLKETRQEAFTKFDELIELKRLSETDWPPLICATGRAEGLLGSASRDEEQLRNSGGTVSNVLKLVRKLIRSYKDVINEAKAKEKKNQKDRQGLQELVDRIDRWRGQLEAYRESHRQDAAAVKAVRGRLSQIDRAIAKTKRRYRRNALSYSQAKGVLQELWLLAHGEDLPVERGDRIIRVREIEG